MANRLPSIENLSVEDLETLIDRARELRAVRLEEAKAAIVARVKADAAAIGLSVQDVLGLETKRRKRADAGLKLDPKYVGPNGETYGGRGPVPAWLRALEAKGHKREKYLAKPR